MISTESLMLGEILIADRLTTVAFGFIRAMMGFVAPFFGMFAVGFGFEWGFCCSLIGLKGYREQCGCVGRNRLWLDDNDGKEDTEKGLACFLIGNEWWNGVVFEMLERNILTVSE
jgi:hypothetical protein